MEKTDENEFKVSDGSISAQQARHNMTPIQTEHVIDQIDACIERCNLRDFIVISNRWHFREHLPYEMNLPRFHKIWREDREAAHEIVRENF